MRGKNYKNDFLTVIKFFVYMSAWDSLNDTFCNWYTEDLLILYLPIRLIKVYKHLVYVPQVYWCIAKTGSQKIRSLIYPPPKKIVFRKLNWLFICSVGRTNDHTLDITYQWTYCYWGLSEFAGSANLSGHGSTRWESYCITCR